MKDLVKKTFEKIFSSTDEKENQVKIIKEINPQSSGKRYREFRKPFISKENHDLLVRLAKGMRYYYNTKIAGMYMNGNRTPHKIIVIKDRVYFQKDNSPLISLKSKLEALDILEGIESDNILSGIVNISARYTKLLEDKQA